MNNVNISKELVNFEKTTIEWNGAQLEINKHLSVDVLLVMIQKIIQGCFTENGEYIPEAKRYAFEEIIIAGYTNAVLPDEAIDRCAILDTTDLYATVVEYIDSNQLDYISDSVDEYIAMRRFDRREVITKEMNDMYLSMKNLMEIMENTIGGLDKEQFNSLVDLIGNSKLDEEKIVKAVAEERSKKINEAHIDSKL